MRRYRQRYGRERDLFDRWASWCERQWDESLGLPRVTWLAKLMQYGERMGVVHAASSWLPPDDSDAETVETYMGWLKDTCPADTCRVDGAPPEHMRRAQGLPVAARGGTALRVQSLGGWVSGGSTALQTSVCVGLPALPTGRGQSRRS